MEGETIRYDLKYNSLEVQNQVQSNLNKIVEEISENTNWSNPWQELIFRISMGYERTVDKAVLEKIAKRQKEQRQRNLETQRKAREYFVD